MKIQYCSDLHLEFAANSRYLQKNPIAASGDILLLAGDIVPFSVVKRHDSFFDSVSKDFKTVYWLPGNHEYYGYDIADKCGTFYEPIRENLFLLNNQVIKLGAIRFVFSTLWSAISLLNRWTVQQSISDFHVIKYKGQRFTTGHFTRLHEQSKDFLRSSLLSDEDHSRTVVVTHHVPTFLNYPEQYANSPLSEAFGVELFDLIERSGAAYWIYGHHHKNVSPFLIGSTKLITNQLGYVEHNEHEGFHPRATIQV